MSVTMHVLGLFPLLLIGCGDPTPPLSTPVERAGTRCDTLFRDRDLFALARFIDSEHYQIVWGNSVFSNTTRDTVQILPAGVLHHQWHNAQVIFVQQSCGTACSYGYALPMSPAATERHYWYPLAEEPSLSLLAYHQQNDSSMIRVENVITHAQRDIERPFASGPIVAAAIDSISFQADRLMLKWRDRDGQKHAEAIDISDLTNH